VAQLGARARLENWAMMLRLIVLSFLTVGLAAAGPPPVPAPAPIQVAQDGCAANCRAQHNQCRIATKGSPSCDAQLQACMQRCIPTKTR
jgi:hypothetical protein